MADQLPKITFYDIDHSLTPRTRSWSPFTVRTLLALRHRNLPYERVAVSYPDIEPLLKSKGVTPPDVKRAPYTLPALDLTDRASGAVTTIMDSAAIADALEALVPVSAAHPALFPGGDETKALAARVEKAMWEGVAKVSGFVMPHVPPMLDPRGREYFLRTRREWWGKSMEEIAAEAPEEELDAALEAGVQCIADVYLEEAKQASGKGVFIGASETPSYADFVAVACLEWWRCAREEPVNKALGVVEGGLLLKVMQGCQTLLY